MPIYKNGMPHRLLTRRRVYLKPQNDDAEADGGEGQQRADADHLGQRVEAALGDSWATHNEYLQKIENYA